MKIFDLDVEKYNLNENNFIALGNFDGLHLAHIKIIENLIIKSKEQKVKSSILLFKNHTSYSIGNRKVSVLMSLSDKIDILKSIGIDNIFLVSFDKVKSMDSRFFIEEFLINDLKIKGVFVGFDYRFGYKATGNTKNLLEYSINNLYVSIMEPVLYEKKVVSSTSIKNYIENNDLKLAEKLLNREYWLKGKVIDGKKLGSKLGFPTANISLSENYVLPQEGVYFSEICIDNNKYFSVTSLGKNITLNEDIKKIESHILDFNENIYGKNIRLRFIFKLRDMIKFDSLEKLTEQVNLDIESVKLISNSKK